MFHLRRTVVLGMALAQTFACSAELDSVGPSAGDSSTHDGGTPSKDAGGDAGSAGSNHFDAGKDSAPADATAQPEAAAPSCPGIQTWSSGKCVCPTNMDPKGAACVETFDHPSKPADGWVWTQGSATAGCTSSETGEGCNATAPWPDPACNYTIGGNVGWTIIDSPAPGGGKALQEYSYANNGCCWQGDSIQKTYSLGNSYRIDELELSLFASAAGSGAAWQCGFISVSLNRDGESAGTVQYDDPIHGSQNGCGYGKPLPLQQDGVAVFDLAQDFAGSKDARADEITIKIYAYSCEPGVSHSLTIDDVTIELKP